MKPDQKGILAEQEYRFESETPVQNTSFITSN